MKRLKGLYEQVSAGLQVLHGSSLTLSLSDGATLL
jgi:hypothetical protein